MEREGNKAYMVKDNKEARMAFIMMTKDICKHKDDEHLNKYEGLWDEYIEDAAAFRRKYYHNISEDEFRDFVFITSLAKIDKTKK